MNGLILSKAAKEYLHFSQEAGLETADWLATSQIESVLCLPKQKKDQITWLLAEPDLAIQVLNELPNLQWLQSTWAGVEKILGTDFKKTYVLTNIKGIFAPLMTEYALAYMLAHERDISNHRLAFKEKRWLNQNNGVIRGKTVLLMGLGSIGAGMARAFNFLGMHVIGVVHTPRTVEHVDEVGSIADLPQLLAKADYVINILPNTESTQNIVNRHFLQNMQSHAVFINVGRGQAVVEADLADALSAGVIAGAVLDVYRTEPLPADHVFWQTPHLTLTSHTAAPSFPKDVFEIFKDNFERFSTGQDLKYVVDFERGY